jgi:hypothetical protein
LKRIEGRGIDIITRVHALVGVVWILGAVVSLFLAVQVAIAPGDDLGAAWERIALFQSVASTSSVVMFAVALVYSIATPWGFFKDRGVILNWVLFIAATAFGGPGISATRAHATTLVIALTAAEVVVLVAACVVGVRLRRARRSGASAVG